MDISSNSSPVRSPKKVVLNVDEPFIHGSATASEAVELHHRPAQMLMTEAGGDYHAINNLEDAKNICYIESKKLWAIAAPIAFNILCNYGINSFTNIFVGHIGDVELSAVAISLSVIANFSFGFLVCFPHNFLLHACNHNFVRSCIQFECLFFGW